MNNKSAELIKLEYSSVMLKAKVTSFMFVLLILPRLILAVTDLDVFFGLNYNTALIPMGVAVVMYMYFYQKYWRCPGCNEFPGGGWSRAQCKKCDVALK